MLNNSNLVCEGPTSSQSSHIAESLGMSDWSGILIAYGSFQDELTLYRCYLIFSWWWGSLPYTRSGRTGTTRKLTNFMWWLKKGIQRSPTLKRPSDMKSLRLEHRSWHWPSTPKLPTCCLSKPQASDKPVAFSIKKGEGANPPNPFEHSSGDESSDDEGREGNVKQTNGPKQELNFYIHYIYIHPCYTKTLVTWGDSQLLE